MELLGLALAIPVSAVASVVYCLLAEYVIRRIDILRRAGLALAVAVLVGVALEIIAFGVYGFVEARNAFGTTLVVVHTLTFFLAAPAAANVLILRRTPARWYLGAIVCFVVCISLVLFNIIVSEAWYGIDGIGGPFSAQEEII